MAGPKTNEKTSMSGEGGYKNGWSLSRSGMAVCVLLAAATLLLLLEHRAHVLGALPLLLLLLLCVGMHFFMHGGHGREGGAGHSGQSGEHRSS